MCKGSLQYGYTLRLNVSLNMGPFTDNQHKHPGIFTLELPPSNHPPTHVALLGTVLRGVVKGLANIGMGGSD